MAANLIYGVDVHPDFQRGLHWPTLYAQGYRYGAIKHTQGVGYQHNLTDEWVRDCRAAGLLAGAYHWLDASDGAAQARWFWRRVLECGGPKGMLVMLDVEDTGKAAQVTAWAREWTRLSGGHPFAIYTGGWWWKPNMGGFNGAAITPTLWHSSYLAADADSIPDDPAAFASRIPASWWTPGYGSWKRATFLQFSSKGDAGRLANRVDLNATWLTMDQLRALAGLSSDTGAPGDTGGGITPIEEDDMPVTDAQWKAHEAKVDGLVAALKSIADRQQYDAFRIDGIYFDRPAAIGGPAKGEVSGLHATLEALKGKAGGITDADLAKVTEAVEAAVKAAVSNLLAGAGLNVTGHLELNPLPPKP